MMGAAALIGLYSLQHGQPLHVIDMGETAIDEATFEEFLDEMREHYTADKVSLRPFTFPWGLLLIAYNA